MPGRAQSRNSGGGEVPIASLLFLLDPSGAVIGWSVAAERECGYAPGELRGLGFDRLFAADPPEDGGSDWRHATESDGAAARQGWFTRKDGSRFHGQVTIEPTRADGPGISGFAVVGDVAGSPNNFEAADNEQQFRILVQGVTDYAIYLLDPAGNITNWNPGGERIKGYRSDEIVGQHFSRFYTEEDRAAGEPQRALAIAARDGRYEQEGWRVRKDGTRFWANAIIDAIRDPEGKLIGFAKVTRDLAAKKEVEDALKQTQAALAQSQKMEAVGQLTGGVAHDFNNLLTVITNALDLLARPSRDEAQKRRVIDSALRAADRGAKLTQQLLAFSRRQPLLPGIYNINSLIGGFEAVLRRACPEPIEFEMNLSAGPLAANIDGPQFETALLNLIVNSRDAMPQGGKVRITTRLESIDRAHARVMSDIAPGDYVSIAVTDTGEGMPAEVLARAYEPFFTTKEVGKGSGLGLSQVYGFVMQSGGHVAIDSALGVGTTVTIYLPAEKAAADRHRGQAEVENTAAAGRILVVEDDPEVLEVTVETLRRTGYEVLTAADGPAALAVLRREADIDILFSDIVMPHGMNGVELARTAMRLRPQLRVLLASGYPTRTMSGAPLFDADGEFAFLSKPYRGSELAEALRALQAA
jgi:PAS domain S-box-containing protein